MEKWRRYKDALLYVFFTDKDVIQRNTAAFHDFWLFLEKYERFNTNHKNADLSSTIKNNKFDFPERYDKRHKINFAFSTEVIEARFGEYKSRLNNREMSLGVKDLKVFYDVICYYLAFLQRKNFSRLLKLKKEQNNLPIKQHEDEITDALQTHQVVIVAGDTGCGKSTQVPQYLLNAGFTNIACTQPRRLACISLAKRVGFETLNEYKSDIAYQVRFDSSRTKNTKVVFLTEGLLLRQFQSDPSLSMYEVIVVDEVHERHINGDFLLGVLKCLLQQRENLKVILMSATINIDLFSNYFQDAPVIQVPGRLYPIELQYLPHFIRKKDLNEKADRLDPSPYLKVMQFIDKKYTSTERGDLLIFMSGMSEITSVVEAARDYARKSKAWIVLPLHSSLSVEEQDKIFDVSPDGVRKCIVSTNIAETSITIDGVRFIVDSGKVKEMSYDPLVKMQRLQEFWISQASAEQRKGRAGRTGPGVCFRLYSEDDYSEFSQYSTPEIHRVPLDTLVLQMASLGLRDSTRFPFIEPPSKSSLVNAAYFLKQQRALTVDGDLTTLGRMLSRLPVDIVIGKMLIMGSLFSMVDPILVIATALSVQSPFSRRFSAEADRDCEMRRREFFSPHGDAFTLLNAYDEWILVKSDRKENSKKWCRRRGLEEQRFYEMTKLKRQFEELLADHRLLAKKERRGGSSFERKHLLKLKREHGHHSARRRKVLKLEGQIENSSDDDESVDIHDIDFKLRHDLSRLERSSKRRFTHRDVNLLKLIISSGLYPQVVLPDETNPWRKPTEQLFHSKDKSFLMLHPLAVYSLQPDYLESMYDKKANKDERHANARDVLVYVSLLETNKPYVVNTTRVPALQSFMLLASKIDTDAECTRIVFDEWVELTCDDCDTKELLSNVVQIRKAWDMLLEQKLSVHETEEESERLEKLCKISHLEEIVSTKLAEFIDADISYKLRRVSTSELKHMYPKPNQGKVGVAVTSYLRFGSLADSLDSALGQGEYLREHYHCPKCKEHLICTVAERIQHDAVCGMNTIITEAAKKKEKPTESSVPRDQYTCEVCQQTFEFTRTEILKHRMSHK